MKVLVTGSKGFIGQNLIAELNTMSEVEVFECHRDTSTELLDAYCKEANFIFHLAGVNRPEKKAEFMKGNYDFTEELLKLLKEHNSKAPIMISSSTQASLDNPYGKSKSAGENAVFEYGKKTGVKTLVYRFPNVFGKWSKPNYNTVIATFCHNIIQDKEVQINDPEAELNLVYIDDVIIELVNALNGKENRKDDYCEVSLTYHKTLQEIVDLLYQFKQSREDKSVPNMEDDFTKKLYSTYLSFLPKDKFSYPLKMNKDDRGSFT